MLLSRYCRIIAVAAALCLLPIAVLGQEFSPIKRNNNAPPKPSGATPRTPDGHPDLTGVWNGLGDNLLGVQIKSPITVCRSKVKARRATFTAEPRSPLFRETPIAR